MQHLWVIVLSFLWWSLSATALFAQTAFNVQGGESLPSNDGSLSYNYTFDLPQSRGRYQPTLALSYNSNAGVSPYGLGFSLSMTYIERVVGASPTGDDGNPRLLLQLVSPMAKGVLLPVGNGQYYRVASETTYLEFSPVGPPLSGQEFRPVPTAEPNTNRDGMDRYDFEVLESDEGICQAACANDPACLAYTYRKSPPTWCWLKDGTPSATLNPAFNSGTKNPLLLQSFEVEDSDRTGSDRPPMLEIPGKINPGTALSQCQVACLEGHGCKAYAFRKTEGGGPHQCWLKGEPIPPQTWSEGFISGLKPVMWEAYDAQGNHFRFERMVDAQGMPCKTPCVRWYLSSVEDVDGNLTKYEYYNQGASAGLLLARILYNNYDAKHPSYTGRVGDTAAFGTIIELTYQNMPPHAQVEAGSLITYSQRLGALRILRPGPNGPVSTGGFDIVYGTSQETGRSLISAIQRIGRDGQPAPNQTTFDYSGRRDQGKASYKGLGDGLQMAALGSVAALWPSENDCQLWMNYRNGCWIPSFAAWIDLDNDHRPDVVWGGGGARDCIGRAT